MSAIAAMAAASAAASIISSAYNVHEARQSRRFARDQSATKHQREVIDLRKAGLNPILSATKGMGGASPTAAPASIRAELTSAGELASKAGILGATEDNLDAGSAKAIADEQLQKSKTIGQNIQNKKDGYTEPLYDIGSDVIKTGAKTIKKRFQHEKKKIKFFIDKGKKFFKKKPVSKTRKGRKTSRGTRY